jgi:phage gp29-like protein
MKPSDFSQQIESSWWDRINVFSQEFTPDTVQQIMLNAESGYLGNLYDLYFKIRTFDARVAGAVQSRALAVTKLDYQITPGDPENAKSVEVADFVRDNLDRLPMKRLKKQMMDGIFDGLALFENIFEQVDGKIMLKEVKQISQSRLGFVRMSALHRGEFGDITIQNGLSAYEPIKNYPAGKIVTVVNSEKPGYYDMTGVMRAVLRWYTIKYFTVKFWSQYSETNGYPVQTIELMNSDFEKYQADARNFMKSVQRNKFATLREGMKYAIHETNKTASSQMFSDLISLSDDEMVIAILGQTLTTSQGSSGSRALGDVHKEVRKDIVTSDCERLDEVINSDMVDVLVRLNYTDMPYKLYPRFDTMIPRQVDREATGRAIKTITSIPGINIPLAWAYEELNIPMPDKDEPVIKGTTSMIDEIYGTE